MHRDVYGVRNSKILARFNDKTDTPQPGRIIARSAENLALYTLASYITHQLGAYPHLPVVNTKPIEEPNFHGENPFEIDSNGNVVASDKFPSQTNDELVFGGEEGEGMRLCLLIDSLMTVFIPNLI